MNTLHGTRLDFRSLTQQTPHVVHVIVAPQSPTINIQRHNFFYSLRQSAAVVQCSSNFLKFSLHREALSLLLTSSEYSLSLLD